MKSTNETSQQSIDCRITPVNRELGNKLGQAIKTNTGYLLLASLSPINNRLAKN